MVNLMLYVYIGEATAMGLDPNRFVYLCPCPSSFGIIDHLYFIYDGAIYLLAWAHFHSTSDQIGVLSDPFLSRHELDTPTFITISACFE